MYVSQDCYYLLVSNGLYEIIESDAVQVESSRWQRWLWFYTKLKKALLQKVLKTIDVCAYFSYVN